MTWMLGLGSGQGSGSSQTRRQRRPWWSNRRSQPMPYRITLTVRIRRRPELPRCWGDGVWGGARSWLGAMARSWASSTRVP